MNSCPDDQVISSYLLGELSDVESDQISLHFSDCLSCQSTINAVMGGQDTFVDDLKNPPPVDKVELESACQEVVERIKAIKNEPFGEAENAGDDQQDDSYRSMPESIRDYKIVKKLGQGGMGAVFEALHTKLDTTVALKVLAADRMNDPEMVNRFNREMKAIGKLKHPNIVGALDAGEWEGQHYLVMELIDGCDLSEIVAIHGNMSVANACELVRQAAEGLQHAHEHGMVHRDIKPSNLMLTNSGSVVILDMGLARLSTHGEGELTSTGQIMGTLDYMAPEQGNPSDEIDIRADIYSLGATLYKFLAGRAPFAGQGLDSPIKKLMALATKKPECVSTFRADVPSALADLIATLLAKEPTERPTPPRELATLLEPYTNGHDLLSLLQPAEFSTAVDAGLSGTNALEETTHLPQQTEAATSPKRETLNTSVSGAPAEASFQIEAAASTPAASPVTAPVPAQVQTQPKPRRVLPIPVLIGIGFVSLLAIAGITFFMQAKDGTVRFEINDPSINVSFAGKDVTIKDGIKEYRFAADDHELSVSVGDLNFNTKEFKLGKGENVRVKVTYLDGELVVARDAKELHRARISESKPSVATSRPTTPKVDINGLAWRPNTEQAAFLKGINALPAEARAKAVESKLKSYCYYGGEISFNEDRTAVTIAAPGMSQIWPLVGVPTLKSVDLSKASATNLSPLKDLPLEDLQVNLAAYNPQADVFLASMESLQRVNQTPKKEWLEQREKTRKEVDEFAASAVDLSNEQVVQRLTQMLKELNPKCEDVKIVARQASKPMEVRLGSGAFDLSPVRALDVPHLRIYAPDVVDVAPLSGMKLRELTWHGAKLAELSGLDSESLRSLSLGDVSASDLSPLAQLNLKSLSLESPVSDLSPLRGMPLERLVLNGCPVTDLSPLSDSMINHLDIANTPVADISALEGMPLTYLNIRRDKTHDLYRWHNWGPAPVAVADLTPLKGAPLLTLMINERPEDVEMLRTLPLQHVNQSPAIDFFKGLGVEHDLPERSNDPAEFMAAMAKYSPSTKLQLVLAKLRELAPLGLKADVTYRGREPISLTIDHAGTTPTWPMSCLKTLEHLDLSNTTIVRYTPLGDLGITSINVKPVLYNTNADETFMGMASLTTVNDLPKKQWWDDRQGMRNEIDEFTSVAKSLTTEDVFAWINPRLQKLNPGYKFSGFATHVTQPGDSRISFSGKLLRVTTADHLVDLGPFRVLPFEELQMIGRRAIQDLSSLRGLPLRKILISGSPLSDLSPLVDSKVQELELTATQVHDLSPLNGLDLTSLNLRISKVADLAPLANLPLETLIISSSEVADLSPLANLPLSRLDCTETEVTDLSPIRGRKLKMFAGDSRFGTHIADLSPLRGMPIESIVIRKRIYCDADESVLKSLPLKSINGMKAEDYWSSLKKERLADKTKIAEAAKLSAEARIAKVKKEMPERSFSLSFEKTNNIVTHVIVANESSVYLADLRPLLQLPTLTHVTLDAVDPRTDLSPLTKLPNLKSVVFTGAKTDELLAANKVMLKQLPIEPSASSKNGNGDFMNIPSMRFDLADHANLDPGLVVPALRYDAVKGKSFTLELWIRREPAKLGNMGFAYIGSVSLMPSAGGHSNSLDLRFPGHAIEGFRSPKQHLSWTHLAAVFDKAKSEYRFYVDGTLVGAKPMDPAQEGLHANNRELSFASKFTGHIGEARLSSVARYQKSFKPTVGLRTDEHTLALYDFKKPGDVVKDQSGNNHHAKIASGEWSAPNTSALGATRWSDDRIAAKWVLELGGKVVTDAGAITSVAGLPKSSFHVTAITIPASRRLQKERMQVIGQLPELIGLNFDGNELTDADLQYLKEAKKLKVLRLIRQKITDAGLEHISGLTELEELVLNGTLVQGNFLQHLKHMKQLSSLVVQQTAFNGEGIENLLEMDQLSVLDLYETQIDDASLVQIGKLASLKHLRIGKTQVTDAGIAHLKGLKNLETLSIGYAEIGDEGLEHVKEIKQLKRLYIDHTPVTDAGLKHVGTLTELAEVQLQGTPTTTAGITELQKALPKCVIRNK